MPMSPDEFVREFMHIQARDYDPAARRAYYLRTRQLKGRKVGSSKTAVARHPAPTSFSPQKPKPATPKRAQQTRESVEARVAALKEKLATVQRILAELVAQAKLRSGVESQNLPKPINSPPSTPQQKAQAAKAAQDYYEKNKEEILSDQAKALEGKIRSVEAKIKEMRAQLAVVKARTLKATPLERATRLPRKTVPVGAGTRIPSRKENSR